MGAGWDVEWIGGWNSGFQGRTVIGSAGELAAVLSRRDPNGDAEFTLAGAGQMFPYLVLSVHGDLWYIHFFGADREPGSFVMSDYDGPDVGDTVRLPAGNDIEVARGCLVNGSAAERLAADFLATGRRPDGVEWVELSHGPGRED